MAVAFGLVRTVARSVIPSLVKRGFGANAITRVLKVQGLSFRRINMLKDIREINGLVKMEKYTRAVSGVKQFPKFGMVEHELKRDRRYRVFATMKTRNMVTGEESEKDISFYDDEHRSKDNWVEAFEDQYEEKMYEKQEEITGISIRSVEHQRGWMY